jgi:hypothetical protein
MDRKYEKFLGGPTRSADERVYVSLSKANLLVFNNNCYKLLGKPTAVYLYFSRSDDMIAVEPVHSRRLPAAFPVLEKYASGWRVNASPFCKHFNIRLDTTERFISPEFRDGALQLKLSETVTVRQLRRGKRK